MRTILILEVTMIKGFLWYWTLCNLADTYQVTGESAEETNIMTKG